MVETSRLTIIPLHYQQLELYLQGENKFEKEFRLTNTGRKVMPDIKKRVMDLILPKMKEATGDDYLFYTFWLVIERSTKTIVAELGFKGEPGKNGKIEIGYGTMPEHRGKSFMTEAVGGMINWATTRTDLQYIFAETDEENTASIKVVQKNNFKHFRTIGNMLWWKVSVK
jgi:[ribosomal protein S5]-alanine N-acetyltransferase